MSTGDELLAKLCGMFVPHTIYMSPAIGTAWHDIFNFLPSCMLYGVMTLVSVWFHKNITQKHAPRQVTCASMTTRFCTHNVLRALLASDADLRAIILYDKQIRKCNHNNDRDRDPKDSMKLIVKKFKNCLDTMGRHKPQRLGVDEVALPFCPKMAYVTGILNSFLDHVTHNFTVLVFGNECHMQNMHIQQKYTLIQYKSLNRLEVCKCPCYSNLYGLNTSNTLKHMTITSIWFMTKMHTSNLPSVLYSIRRHTKLWSVTQIQFYTHSNICGYVNTNCMQTLFLLPRLNIVDVCLVNYRDNFTATNAFMRRHGFVPDGEDVQALSSRVEQVNYNADYNKWERRRYRRDETLLASIRQYEWTGNAALVRWAHSLGCIRPKNIHWLSFIAEVQAPACALQAIRAELP